MPVYRLKSDILGIDFGVESQQELTERDYFDILKTKVSPQKMLRAYKNNKDDEKVQALATKALDNNYFEGADFGTAFSEGAKSFGRGVKNMLATNIYGTSRLLDATMQYGEVDESQKYDELVEEGIKKAGQQLKGLSYASKRTDRTIEDDLSQALQFAGLSQEDENLKKRVIAEARRQDNSQAEATRAQMGVDAVGMMSMLGAKLFQGLGDAEDIVTGKVSFGGDSKKRKLRQLDYLIEQDYIGRTIERGAELGLQLGGAMSTISQVYTGMDLSPFEKNEEALRDVKSGLVKPDRDVAMLGSMFADPGMGATVLASGGLAFGRNLIARGAIIKTGQKAAQESALRSTIAQLSDIANPSSTQKSLLKTAEKNLAKVTGSGEKLEKLVAKAEGIAQAEAGKLLQNGQGNTPMAARLFQAIDKAPPPKAPFSNRMTGKILEKAGISAEYLGRTIEFLQRLPEETLGTLFMRSGMDEQAAMTASRATARTLQGTAAAGVVTGGFNEFTPELENLGLALLLAPGGSSLVTRFGHDTAILGKQLQYAQTSSPLFQRIAQLDPADSSLTAVTLDRTSALTIPGTISGLAEGIFAKSRQFGPSPALKAPATALTRTGLGNTLTGAVNTTKTAVLASTIPGAIGYAVDGEAGAGGAIAASIPFIAAGLGLGTLARYGSQADVRAKMLGDQAYYKDTYLTDTEVGMYDSLAKPVRQAIATSVIQNPDVVYRFQNDRGNSHWSVENGESVVTIFTKSAPQEQLSAVLGHEIAHHIDAFGFMPQIIEQLVGSVEKNQPGLFTEYKNGKPVIIKDAEGRDVYATNKEFAKHRQRYLDLLEQSGIDKNSPDYQAYANDDSRIAREIFASHGAAWYFGGDFVTRNYQGAGAKMMGAILDPLFSSPGLRKFFHRIGLATQETTGLVADPLRLFPELKEVPALTRMIEKYNDDVRGFGPQARREGRGRGNLVDPEFADEIATASLTAKDLENPAIVNRLKAGGVVKIKDDGSIETDASGKPVFLPSREVNKKNKQLSQDILQIIRKKEDAGETFGEGHVSMEKTADGKERAAGRFLDPSIIDELAKTGKYNPHQLAALKQISQTLRNNTGDVWNLFYYSALKWNKAGRKVYGQIKGGDRKSLPFGIEITKDGNINIQTISVDAFKKNLEWFAKSKGYEKKMSEAFGGMNAWENAQNAYKLLPTYLQNHMKGIINGTPESGITPLQRDLINAAIGRVNADQVKANPILEGLGDRRSQRQQSIRSRRLDRIGNAIRGESGFPAFKSAIEQNKVPMYMPAAYHGTPHTFAAEPGAPFGRFRASAIGTGEGAQAYGHGLYFAGKREVAEHYRKVLSGDKDYSYLDYDGATFDRSNPRHEAARRLLNAKRDNKTRSSIIDQIDGQLRRQNLHPSIKEKLREVSNVLQNKDEAKVSGQGSLYKVELAPKENEYLLWDKPVSDSFIDSVIDKSIKEGLVQDKDTALDAIASQDADRLGSIFYSLLSDQLGGDKQASQFLKEAGIPGIKYLDGSSRSKGEGDYNYVIFDEADVAITEKLFMPASEAGAGKPGKGDTTPASIQSWDDANPTFGANFSKGMAKDNKEAAALLRKSYEDEFGEPIKAQDFTQEQVEWLGGMLAQEGEAALGRTGNAVNWYTSAVEKALSVAEEIFPEIGQKFEAKDRFLGALSITSQNMRVMDNAKAAVSQYDHKIRTGKFNYNIKHGAKADAITSNLKLYDKVEAKMGVEELHAFLDRDFTVKKLTEWGRDFFGDKKFSIAGYSTDKVKGSAIFGPKIGQGFFQNLRGNYDPVTVDLWLRRTYGRLTGLSLDTALSPGDIGRIIYAVRNNKGKRKFAGLEMPEFLRGVSISGKLQKNGVANFKISDKAFDALFGDNTIGRDNYEAIYEFAEKLNREWERSFAKANTDVNKAKDAIKKAKKEKRGTTNLEKQLAKFEAEKVAIGKEKPQWAKAGSTVNDKLKPIDVPSNAERAVITKAFNVALKSLKDKGINLTPADLQATLWYPEKDIWAYLKGENSDALNMSYDTAMEVIRDQR